MINKKISVIIPFFNEELEIKDLVIDLNNIEKKKNYYSEYLFISDASTDNSLNILKNNLDKFPKIKKKSKIIKNKKNLGWTKSLLKGIQLVKNEYFIFIPGDNEVPLSMIDKSISFEYDVLILERTNMKFRPIIRQILSYFYRYIICLTFNIKRMDLNGIFLFKTKKFQKLKLSSNSFFISAEIILKSISLGMSYKSLKVIKLKKKNFYQSTSLNWKQFFLVLKEFIITFYDIKLKILF